MLFPTLSPPAEGCPGYTDLYILYVKTYKQLYFATLRAGPFSPEQKPATSIASVVKTTPSPSRPQKKKKNKKTTSKGPSPSASTSVPPPSSDKYVHPFRRGQLIEPSEKPLVEKKNSRRVQSTPGTSKLPVPRSDLFPLDNPDAKPSLVPASPAAPWELKSTIANAFDVGDAYCSAKHDNMRSSVVHPDLAKRVLPDHPVHKVTNRNMLVTPYQTIVASDGPSINHDLFAAAQLDHTMCGDRDHELDFLVPSVEGLSSMLNGMTLSKDFAKKMLNKSIADELPDFSSSALFARHEEELFEEEEEIYVMATTSRPDDSKLFDSE